MTLNAIMEIEGERLRQIEEEGFDAKRDDAYESGELAAAAGCYALFEKPEIPVQWPWPDSWWKPTDRRRNLVKAGALIVAEIERLDRADE